MTEYDIITSDGHRLLTCVRDDKDIFLKGKSGGLDINSFLEQVFNPGKTLRRSQMKEAG